MMSSFSQWSWETYLTTSFSHSRKKWKHFWTFLMTTCVYNNDNVFEIHGKYNCCFNTKDDVSCMSFFKQETIVLYSAVASTCLPVVSPFQFLQPFFFFFFKFIFIYIIYFYKNLKKILTCLKVYRHQKPTLMYHPMKFLAISLLYFNIFMLKWQRDISFVSLNLFWRLWE